MSATAGSTAGRGLRALIIAAATRLDGVGPDGHATAPHAASAARKPGSWRRRDAGPVPLPMGKHADAT